MKGSIFFQLKELQGATFTAFQRELLAMTLEANPGVDLGTALRDVFDYLGEKIKQPRLEAIADRLIRDNRPREGEEEGQQKAQQKSEFGEKLISWVTGLHASERLLVAVGYDTAVARRIYCEEDYLVTDTICSLFLSDRWQSALVQLQAAAAPWSGGGKGGPGGNGNVEYYDLSQAGDDDPQWAELAACLGGR